MTDSVPRTKTGRRVRPNKRQWQDMRIEYEGGNAALAELAEKYSTHVATISRKANREGWIRPKTQHAVYERIQTQAIEKAATETVEQVTDHVKTYFGTQVKHYHKAKAVLLRQLAVYDIISQADVHKLQRAYENAKRFLLDGNVDEAHKIITKCGIDQSAPYKVKTIIDGLVTLDTAERRLLGLDKGDAMDKLKDDPIEGWIADLGEARKKYVRDKGRKEKS